MSTPGGEPLLRFVAELRAQGASIPTSRVHTYLQATSLLGLCDADSVRRCGRAALCSSPDDVRRHDQVFERFFAGLSGTAIDDEKLTPTSASASALGEDDDDVGPGVERVVASVVERLKHEDVAELRGPDRERVLEALGRIPYRGPVRRVRRTRRSNSGAVDPQRTVREQLRRGGDAPRFIRQRRRFKPRAVIVLVDISGSMQPYAELYLRLARHWVRAAPRTTYVFALGTRLTPVTSTLDEASTADVVLDVGRKAPDWAGGTRLDDGLRRLIEGREDVSPRGAVVVLMTDGFERIAEGGLGATAARLSRIAHKVIWVSPHAERPGYSPVQAGVRALMPHVDIFLGGHTLATLREALEIVENA